MGLSTTLDQQTSEFLKGANFAKQGGISCDLTAIPLTLRNSQSEFPCQNYRIVPHLKSLQESQS
jgi:hypothetical protein